MTALATTALEAQLAGDVTSATRGDRDAFTRLIAASSGVVCAVALAITRDVAASEDVAQDVFLAAWTGLPRLRDPASFLPWIRQVTRFRARTWLRDRVPRRADDDGLAALPDPAPSGEARLLAEEERRALDEAFAALSEDAREVVTLYYREGASTAQLAALLGVAEAAVRQRLSRTRGELREEVLQRLGETLKKTGPGAAFTAAVLALTMAAPGGAAAATATAAGVAGKIAFASKLASVAGGAGLGLFGGLLGVFLGLRPHLREAIDDDERRELVRFGRHAALVTVAAVLGYALTGVLESVALGLVTQGLFGGAMMVLYWGRLPRITARRDAIRVAADPAFARRLRTRRTWGRLAFGIGYAVSTWTLLHTLISLGWL
jgi:RNA polymerase sigma factor (sigma-70 family)